MSLAVAISASPLTASTDIPAPPIPHDVKGMIVYYGGQYGAEIPLLDKMAFCESTYNPKAVGDSGRAHNVYQYHEATFYSHAKLMGEKLNYKSAHDQIKLTAWISVNHPDKLRAWTSYRAIKNGGTYSFYSKQLKKHYTVKCK